LLVAAWAFFFPICVLGLIPFGLWIDPFLSGCVGLIPFRPQPVIFDS
jgi:hypothetical protein